MIRAESHLLSQVNFFLVTFYFVRCRTQFLSLEFAVIISLFFVSSVITGRIFSSFLLKLGMRSLPFQQCVSPFEFLLITLCTLMECSPALVLLRHLFAEPVSGDDIVPAQVAQMGHWFTVCNHGIYFCYNLFSRTFILPQYHPVVVT